LRIKPCDSPPFPRMRWHVAYTMGEWRVTISRKAAASC